MKKAVCLFLIITLLLFCCTACGAKKETQQEPVAVATAVPDVKPETPTDSETGNSGNYWDDIDFSTEVHLTFASGGVKGNGPSIGNERAVELIYERSGGKIVIEPVYNGALGSEQSTLAQCMEGSIEMTCCGLGTISPYTSTLDAIQLPFLIGSYEQETELIQSDEFKALLKRASDELNGVTILSTTESGIRHFATIDAPIHTMADISGLKIRSIGNPILDEALRMVGANPVNITFTDLYSSLQNGVIDGEEINVTNVAAQKHYEVVNYVSEIGFYPFISFVVISNATVDSLPDGYFDLIQKTYAECAVWYMQERISDYEASCYQECLDNGVAFNTIEDKDAWIEMMTPLYEREATKDPLLKAFIDKALSLQ